MSDVLVSAGLIRKDYEDALAVQDACNLSGVVHSLAQLVEKLWKDPGCAGTDWINQHPLVVLYVDKLASLAGCQDLGSERVSAAYANVHTALEHWGKTP